MPVADEVDLTETVGLIDTTFKGFYYESNYYIDVDTLIRYEFEVMNLYHDVRQKLISDTNARTDTEKVFMVYQDC